MSHVITTCECRYRDDCEVPGHGTVPLEIDPWSLVDAGEEALGHLRQAMASIIAARSAWVNRGLPGDNPFPASLDRKTVMLDGSIRNLRRWVNAARTVAERRTS